VAGESEVVPRVTDLDALASSTQGKVEIEAIEEGRDEQIVDHLLRSAVLTVFRERCPMETLRDVVTAFEGDIIVHTGEDVAAADYVRLLEDVPALAAPVSSLVGEGASPAQVASAVEFVLEGLHLSKRLNKESVGSRAQYRGR
jgi:magnesium chelatase subunit I